MKNKKIIIITICITYAMLFFMSFTFFQYEPIRKVTGISGIDFVIGLMGLFFVYNAVENSFKGKLDSKLLLLTKFGTILVASVVIIIAFS